MPKTEQHINKYYDNEEEQREVIENIHDLFIKDYGTANEVMSIQESIRMYMPNLYNKIILGR
tara:strand:- start:6332 stop:6517 length:186 start_codon:yes stop_codon:yes gene_type:complete